MKGLLGVARRFQLPRGIRQPLLLFAGDFWATAQEKGKQT